MKRSRWQWFLLLVLLTALAIGAEHPQVSQAQGPECPAGFDWRRMSGAGCMQANCLDIGNAKYTYTGTCACNDG